LLRLKILLKGLIHILISKKLLMNFMMLIMMEDRVQMVLMVMLKLLYVKEESPREF
jgi:hypothetical protein